MRILVIYKFNFVKTYKMISLQLDYILYIVLKKSI